MSKYAHAQFTANSSASNLSSLGVTIPRWATQMIVVVETANGTIRYRADGSSPNTTFGTPITNGQNVFWPIEGYDAIANAQFISTGSNNLVSVEFRRSNYI